MCREIGAMSVSEDEDHKLCMDTDGETPAAFDVLRFYTCINYMLLAWSPESRLGLDRAQFPGPQRCRVAAGHRCSWKTVGCVPLHPEPTALIMK
jgi:hypothetical protein